MKAAIILVLALGSFRIEAQADKEVEFLAASVKEVCQYDVYQPCTCVMYNVSFTFPYYITCGSGVAPHEIQSAFERTPIQDHYSLSLSNLASYHLPANLLSGKRVERINIRCAKNSPPIETFHEDAFKSTRGYTTYLGIDDCDLTAFNFHFLEDFTALTQLFIYYSKLYSFSSLPFLPNLNYLDVDSEGIYQWYPPHRTPKLETFRYRDIYITNPEAMSNLFDYLSQQCESLHLINLAVRQYPAVQETGTIEPDCETKVKQLEMERDQLKNEIDSLKGHISALQHLQEN